MKSEQGDSHEARRMFQVAAHCPSASSLAAYRLGIELERHGESAGALTVWEQALESFQIRFRLTKDLVTRIRHRASQLRNRLPTPSRRPPMISGLNMHPSRRQPRTTTRSVPAGANKLNKTEATWDAWDICAQRVPLLVYHFLERGSLRLDILILP